MADPDRLKPEDIAKQQDPDRLSAAEVGRQVLAESAESVGRRTLDAFSIGYGDEIIARVHSTFADIPYSEALAQSEARTQRFQQEAREQSAFGIDPLDLAGLTIGGGGLFAGLARAPGIRSLGPVSRSVAAGAGVGGAAAAGQPGTLQERIASAPAGAAIGAVAGPAAVGAAKLGGAGLAAIGEVTGRFLPGAQARRGVRDAALALERDQMTGDLATQRLDEMGPQALIADLGTNTREAAQRSVELSGEMRDTAEDLLRSRNRQQGERVTQAFQEAVNEGRSFRDIKKQLDDTRKADASPLYTKVRSQTIKPTQRMRDMIKRDSFRAAYNRARSLATEDGVTLPTYKQLADGEADITGLQTWDYIKRGMDDYIGGMKSQQGVGPARRRAANQTRVDLLEDLDKLYPPYAKARAAWAGPSRSMELMDEGRDVFKTKMDTEDWIDWYRDLPSGEQDYVKLGVVQELTESIGQMDVNRNAARLFNIPNNQAKIAELFPSGENMSRFLNRLIGEEEAALTAREVLGRSPTAGLQARGEQQAIESLPTALQLGRQLLRGDFGAAAEGASRKMAQNLRTPPAQRDATARLLFEPDRQLQLAIIDRLTRMNRGPSRLVMPAVTAGAGGASAAASGRSDQSRAIAEMLLGGS